MDITNYVTDNPMHVSQRAPLSWLQGLGKLTVARADSDKPPSLKPPISQVVRDARVQICVATCGPDSEGFPQAVACEPDGKADRPMLRSFDRRKDYQSVPGA